MTARFILAALCIVAALRPAAGQDIAAKDIAAKMEPCLACHGASGTSEAPEVPSLGGQPALYALIQLVMFRGKQRKQEPMNEVTEKLSDRDLEAMAAFIATLPPPKPEAGAPDAERLARARTLLAKGRCGFCHNGDYSGRDNLPRLAGQREDYLLKALRDYKAGARPEYEGSVMAEAVRPLSDADMADLAHVLARWR